MDNPVNIGRMMDFLETPPECPKPESTDRLLGIKTVLRDTAYEKIAGWDDQELLFVRPRITIYPLYIPK